MTVLMPAPSTDLARAATAEQTSVFLFDMKRQLMPFVTGDASLYATATVQGVHPALLADLYPYNGGAAVEDILNRLNWRLNRNPVTRVRKMNAVRHLTKLGLLTAQHYYGLFAPRINPDPTWQTQRHAQAARLATMLLNARFSLEIRQPSHMERAKLVAYSILDCLYAPEVTNDPDALRALLHQMSRHSTPTNGGLAACGTGVAACVREVTQFKPPRPIAGI